MKKKLHYNVPQLKSKIIGAPSEVLIAGRGLGKTTVFLAEKTAHSYFGTMPRCTGVNVNATYNQAFTRTLPELVRGWQRIGYQIDHHFIIGKRPTDKWKKMWNWKGPFAPPMDYKYFVSWWNGAGMHIISQDRPGSSNGLSIDFIEGDEAKLLNQERLRTETYPANRGIIPEYADNPYHHGVTLTSDMPVGSAGRWLLDSFNAMDKEGVQQIWDLQTTRYQLQYVLKPQANKKVKGHIDKQIEVIDEEINLLRKGLLYYHEASTLDNIHALGIEYIKQQLRDTSAFQFDTQILNLRPLRLEDGFYPDFDEEYHGYFSEDETYFDRTNIDYNNPVFDCRKDKDLVPDQSLHIALDSNKKIHPLVVAQDHPDELRIVNAMHSLYPQKLKAVLKKFTDYYRPHPNKYVYYWYDHTSVGEQRETRICDDVVEYLTDAGWTVEPMYIGQITGHNARYRMYEDVYQETGKYEKKVRYNRENCKSLILSIQLCETENTKDGFGKNKKPEQDKNVPPEEAPHYSEAQDILAVGIYESDLSYGDDDKGGGGAVIG